MREVREIDSELKQRNYERELERCQELGGDIDLYRRLAFNVLQLEQIRLGLENGVDVEKYLDPELTWMEMESTRIQLESGVDISKYSDAGYSWQQCTEIQIGLQEGLDVSLYDNKQYFSQQMQQIRYGLEKNVDVSFYTDPDFDWMQMREIRRGLENGINVVMYADKKYKYSTMREIRRGLEKGRNIVPYAEKGYDGKILREMNRGLDEGNEDIVGYVEEGYRAAQLDQINEAFESKVDLKPYLSNQFHGAQLAEIVKGLKKELDVSRYAQNIYNWFQMREIRFGMEDKLDTTPYENPDFSANQMAEIRKGIIAGVDVSDYAKIYYDPEQMAQMREELEMTSPDKMDEDATRFYEEARLEEERLEEQDRIEEEKLEKERLEAEKREQEQAGVEEEGVAEAEAQSGEAQSQGEQEPDVDKEETEAKAPSVQEDSKESSESATVGKQSEAAPAEQPKAAPAEQPKAAPAEPAKKEQKKEKPRVIIDDFLLDSCVTVAEDKMSAKVCLDLLASMAEDLRVPDIVRALKHLDVKQGIDRERIGQMLKNKEFKDEVVVAKGKLAVDGEDGKFVYHFRKDLKRQPKVRADGSVDYKDMNLFEKVKKGQLIAEYVPATSGAFGFDVLGNMIAPTRGKELPSLHGKGFEMSDDRKKYYSLMDGIIETNENGNIEIRNVYTVPRDVDASTGNISFDGDVQVNGNVLPGFIVSASGNVVVDGNVEGATILSGQDIILHKGCQGQGDGRLEADGMISGQFFESVTIVAGKDVVATYILNCDVTAGGRLFAEGRRGAIIGGNTCAKQGITCRSIGNVAEVPTVVDVGVGQGELSAYQELTKELEKVEEEIKSCEDALAKFMAQPERNQKLAAFCEQLTKAIYSQKTKRKQLQKKKKATIQRLAAEKEARIVVSGSVYPGTKVFLHSKGFKVKEEMRDVQFVKKDNGIGAVGR